MMVRFEIATTSATGTVGEYTPLMIDFCSMATCSQKGVAINSVEVKMSGKMSIHSSSVCCEFARIHLASSCLIMSGLFPAGPQITMVQLVSRLMNGASCA
ncbi:hypothetical protein D3C71_1697090 [compost metagenome]